MFSEQILSANLDALERTQRHLPVFGPLGPDTRAVDDERRGLRVELQTAGGAWVPIDGEDPDAFIAGQLAAINGAADVVLVGPGLGYVLDATEDAKTRFCVIEPDPALTVLFLGRRDWRPWLESGRLSLLAGPQYIGASNCARLLNGQASPVVVVNPVLAQHRPEAADHARRIATRVVSEAASNAEARRQHAGRYLLQTLRNLTVIERESNAAVLDDAFAGKPAVLVAAGPSLDATVGELLPYQDRVVIVACDTTLRPLLAAGIRPHFVVGVDPGAVNARHLSGSVDASGSWLVAEGSLHSTAFPCFAGRTFTFKVSSHEPWPWLVEAGVERGSLRAWGSVATSALDLALRMGCDPLVFIGHDMAYTDDRPYCDNTVFHEEWRAYLAHNPGTIRHYEELMMQGRPVFPAVDISGASTRTAAHLVAFRDWIAEQAAITRAHSFINASGRGILAGPRIAQMSLDAALTQHAKPALEVRSAIERLYRTGLTTASRLAGLRDALLHEPADAAAPVIRRWIDFTVGTVDRTAIRAALEGRASE